MSTRDILIAARALIDTPEKWVKETMHQTRNGIDCYCTMGALMKADHKAPSEVFETFRVSNGLNSVFRWNDAPERTHAEVLAAFDKAIEGAPR